MLNQQLTHLRLLAVFSLDPPQEAHAVLLLGPGGVDHVGLLQVLHSRLEELAEQVTADDLLHRRNRLGGGGRWIVNLVTH